MSECVAADFCGDCLVKGCIWRGRLHRPYVCKAKFTMEDLKRATKT